MSERPVLQQLEDNRLYFDCPGCDMMHAVNVDNQKNPCWSWNNDFVKPTFKPSILVRWAYGENREKRICHSFVRDGNIEFLSDCTHKYAGKTLPLTVVDD